MWNTEVDDDVVGGVFRGQWAPHRGHDGVPCGGEDIGVVLTLVVAFQLLAEILSG